MDRNLIDGLQQPPLQVQAQQLQTQNAGAQTQQLQTQTAGAQTQQLQTQTAVQQAQNVQQNGEQTMLAELAQEERQAAGQAGNAAAPAPPVQEQRRRRSLWQKLADRRQRKAEEKRLREEQRQRERAEREAQAAREAEERRQAEENRRARQETDGPGSAWRKEQEQKIAAIDQALHAQGMTADNANADFLRELQQSEETTFGGMTQEEQASLRNYTEEYAKEIGLGYRSMNHILRNQTYDEDGGGKNDSRGPFYDKKANYQAVKNAISALKKASLPRDMVFRRGTPMSTLMYFLNLQSSGDDDRDDERLRQEIERFNRDGSYIAFDRGFLSTSPFENGGFGAGGLDKTEGAEFFIQGHAGDEALYIAAHSASPEEGETLFQAGTRFRIIKICAPEGGLGMGRNWKVYMETIKDLKPLRGADEESLSETQLEQRREAEEQARREAEERARREAEEQAQREAEEQARREAEERVRREAEEQAQREAEEQARREAEEEANDWTLAQRRKLERMDAALELQGTVEEGYRRLKTIADEKKEEQRQITKSKNTGELIPEKIEPKRSKEEQKQRDFDLFLYQSEEVLWEKLTADEQTALEEYTTECDKEEGLSYQSMNYILRTRQYEQDGGVDQEEETEYYKKKENYNMVEFAIAALQGHPLQEDMVVRRGTNLSSLLRLLGLQSEENPIHDFAKGSRLLMEQYATFNDGGHMIFDRGFLSTSPYKDGGFPTGGLNEADGVEFVIQAHKGDEAIFIGKNGKGGDDETEMVFQAGTKFRIVKLCPPGSERIVHGTAGSWKVYLETVPGVKPLRGENAD